MAAQPTTVAHSDVPRRGGAMLHRPRRRRRDPLRLDPTQRVGGHQDLQHLDRRPGLDLDRRVGRAVAKDDRPHHGVTLVAHGRPAASESRSMPTWSAVSVSRSRVSPVAHRDLAVVEHGQLLVEAIRPVTLVRHERRGWPPPQPTTTSSMPARAGRGRGPPRRAASCAAPAGAESLNGPAAPRRRPSHDRTA